MVLVWDYTLQTCYATLEFTEERRPDSNRSKGAGFKWKLKRVMGNIERHCEFHLLTLCFPNLGKSIALSVMWRARNDSKSSSETHRRFDDLMTS